MICRFQMMVIEVVIGDVKSTLQAVVRRFFFYLPENLGRS